MDIRVSLTGATYRLYRVGAKPMLSVELEGSQEERHAVDRAWAESVFEDIVALEISPVPSSSAMGVGGSSVGISIERGLNQSTFQWWMGAPERWQPLDDIVRRIEAEAQRLSPHYRLGGE